jgi:competence protein ComEA
MPSRGIDGPELSRALPCSAVPELGPMQVGPSRASAWREWGILAWILTGGLALQPDLLFGQRAPDAEHPEGKWEVLDRCRLITNSLVDGDSFQVTHKGREYGFRLYFVDAPEIDAGLKDRVQDQAAYFGIQGADVPRAGELAARFTRTRLTGRDFTVMTRWQNAMGRGTLARFYCQVLVDGKRLDEDLVAAGLVRIFGVHANAPDGTRSTTVISRLKNLELTARTQELGVWDETHFPRGANTTAGAQTNSAAPRAITPDAPLDLNTASYEDLQKLPGIGAKLAERIIARRPYKQVKDLEKVPGIGKKTIERIAPSVRVGLPPP